MARAVAVSALASAALSAAAGVGSILVLSHGSAAVEGSVSARLDYIATHAAAWRAAWMLWAAAGVSILLFYARVSPEGFPGRVALALGTAGLAVRLTAESAIALMPPLDAGLQLAVERWTLVADGLVGHGFETVAGVLIVWGAWTSDRLPHWLVITSLPLWLSGGVLCGAVLAGSSVGVLASTLALVVSATAWFLLVGFTAWKTS